MARQGLRLRQAALLAALGAMMVSLPARAQDMQSQAPPPPNAPSRAVGRTHNCGDYYPDTSRRLNETGDVLVSYDVGADGTISNVRVAKSSGFGRLDLAAVLCVTERWRNTPARRGGVPIASPGHRAIIRFVLSGTESAIPMDALALLMWSIGTLAVAGLAVIGLRQWVFRARACPACHAGNRSILPFAAPGYCSSCGTKFT